MRISDWSSDVCSSDLIVDTHAPEADGQRAAQIVRRAVAAPDVEPRPSRQQRQGRQARMDRADRKSVVEGKSVSVSVDRGGRRIIQKTTKNDKESRKTN